MHCTASVRIQMVDEILEILSAREFPINLFERSTNGRALLYDAFDFSKSNNVCVTQK